MLNDDSLVPSLPVLAVAEDDDDEGEGETTFLAPKDVRDWGYDVKLSRGPVQCNALDGTCEEMLYVFFYRFHDSAVICLRLEGPPKTDRFNQHSPGNSSTLRQMTTRKLET